MVTHPLPKTMEDMIHNNEEVLKHWDNKQVESMYDKNLINLEISRIKEQIKPGSKILDAGCGEGEGTIEYSKIPGVIIHAVDFSDTRLSKAQELLKNCDNVLIQKVDFLNDYELDQDYDCIISQRFLINLMEWELQQKVIRDLVMRLKVGGKLLLMEGSLQGVDRLNELRSILKLEPIPVKWHNLFFDETKLIEYVTSLGLILEKKIGLGVYFFLTRGIRPYFDKNLNWNHEFNSIASSKDMNKTVDTLDDYSRIKLFVFKA